MNHKSTGDCFLPYFRTLVDCPRGLSEAVSRRLAGPFLWLFPPRPLARKLTKQRKAGASLRIDSEHRLDQNCCSVGLSGANGRTCELCPSPFYACLNTTYATAPLGVSRGDVWSSFVCMPGTCTEQAYLAKCASDGSRGRFAGRFAARKLHGRFMC